MIRRGANMEAASRGSMSLHYAVNKGEVAALTLLVRFGANVEALDSDGVTPLQLAVNKKKTKAETALRALGAK